MRSQPPSGVDRIRADTLICFSSRRDAARRGNPDATNEKMVLDERARHHSEKGARWLIFYSTLDQKARSSTICANGPSSE